MRFVSIWSFQLILQAFNLSALLTSLVRHSDIRSSHVPPCVSIRLQHRVAPGSSPPRHSASCPLSSLVVSLLLGLLFPHNVRYFNFCFSSLLPKILSRCQSFPPPTSPGMDLSTSFLCSPSKFISVIYHIKGKISVQDVFPSGCF